VWQVLDAGGVDSGFVNFRAKAQPDGTGILTGSFSASGAPHVLLCLLLWRRWLLKVQSTTWL
jgi:hypothetical protein